MGLFYVLRMLLFLSLSFLFRCCCLQGKSHTCVGELVRELKWTELRSRSILVHHSSYVDVDLYNNNACT